MGCGTSVATETQGKRAETGSYGNGPFNPSNTDSCFPRPVSEMILTFGPVAPEERCEKKKLQIIADTPGLWIDELKQATSVGY